MSAGAYEAWGPVEMGAFELWPAYGPFPRRRRIIRRFSPFYGIGAEEAVPTTAAPAPEVPARTLPPIGKGIFLGTAYGIALGMVTSELIVRKPDPTVQLKQNHQLILFGALIGAAIGGFGAVQA